MNNEKVEDSLILEGKIRRAKVYDKGDVDFVVLTVALDTNGENVIVVGTLPKNTVKQDQLIRVAGHWANSNYGVQFKASSIEFRAPENEEEIFKYLATRVKGIGPSYAKLLLDSFGAEVIDIIANDPDRLLTVPHLGQRKIQKIAETFHRDFGDRQLQMLFAKYDISVSKGVKIQERFGEQSKRIILTNPYQLIGEVKGIGFHYADELAQKIGIPPVSMFRLKAGLHHVLKTAATNEGHCFLSRKKLIERACLLLNVPESPVKEALYSLAREEEVILTNHPDLWGDGSKNAFVKSLYQKEEKIAWRIRTLMEEEKPWRDIDVEGYLPLVEEHLAISLSESQKNAVKAAVNQKLMIVTGGPGVGKTTVVRSILETLRICKPDIRFTLCAPTGRAAKRLSESSGMKAKTIHRLLEINPFDLSFKRKGTNPLETDVVVVDEASMIDVSLGFHLLEAIPKEAAVIFVGDCDQLPSVGAGAFLTDLIASKRIPVIRLTEIYRQAQSSWIVRVANEINQGKEPHFPSNRPFADLQMRRFKPILLDGTKPTPESVLGGDCFFLPIKKERRDEMPSFIVNLVKEWIPEALGIKNPKESIQVLSPMKRSSTGTEDLNKLLQDALNPISEEERNRSTLYRTGDKVMQTENNYEKGVLNGDIGFVRSYEPSTGLLAVEFDGEVKVYDRMEMSQLTLAYACTIHKSQGSEYPVVVIPITHQHHIMLQRNLIYTAVTRGKQLVVLVGELEAFHYAVSKHSAISRQTGLKTWLQAYCEKSC